MLLTDTDTTGDAGDSSVNSSWYPYASQTVCHYIIFMCAYHLNST